MNTTSKLKHVWKAHLSKYSAFILTLFHFRDTYVERQPGESANDRNDRAIRVAAAWYEAHLKESFESENQVRVILLTDDKQNLEKARAEGLLCSTVSEYVRGLDKYPTLQDKLSLKGFSSQSSKEAIFPPHLTVNEIHEGIKSGKLLQGSFLASRENYLEGFVNAEGMEKSVCVFFLYLERFFTFCYDSLSLVYFNRRFYYKGMRA